MADPILLIGAGRMGGALLKGWIAKGLTPIIAVEPRPSPNLLKIARKAKVTIVPSIGDVKAKRVRACVIALKPQILQTEAASLKAIAQSGALIVSIAAGTTIAFLKKACGGKARVIRAMPNTPGSIGCGITGIFAAAGTTPKDRALAESLLAALGQTVWVKREAQIDSVTAVSGSGPAYVFLMVEALAEAGVAEGLPRTVAEQLARATITGAGALLAAEPTEPAVLRQNVTSPGGTTAAALQVLMAEDGLPALMRKAVAAANRRAEELGRLS
ncbi:MAG TPA: pyrroline-5-carboxylate reductase [Rhizomicrobium sp.]|jgi:pyrroline-5-carboxylate reductase|nr:pyrroline-5-carboxylate reductase [Rhizomicrobium sp.]